MKTALFGAAGYAGVELAKLLAVHPTLALACAASDANAGRPLAALTGRAHVGDPTFVTTAQARQIATGCALALLAVPPEAALELAPSLRAAGVRVVDLSNAYRASGDAVYGITTLGAHVREAALVANPGCYATAVITAAAPLVGLVTGDLIVAAGSGVTGAGRKADEALSLGEMFGEVRAYKVLKHQHVPEIEMALGAQVVLTTHLLPIARGIFLTLSAKLAAAESSADLVARFRARYAGDPTVVVAATPEEVSIRRVVGTAQVHVGVASDERRTVVVTAALDNLLKGAATQAIENANLMLGLPRLAGLDHLARHA